MLSIVSVGLSMFVADCVHTDSLIFSHNFTQASLIALASNSAKLYLFMSFQVLACLVMFPFIANMMTETSMFSLDCASRSCFSGLLILEYSNMGSFSSVQQFPYLVVFASAIDISRLEAFAAFRSFHQTALTFSVFRLS